MNGIENNYKSLRLRIYPNKSQEILINKTFGCCRFVYNYYLNEKVNFYKNFVEGIGDKSKRIKILNTFKPKTEKELKKEYSFLTEVSSVSLQQSRINCDKAFTNFFQKKKNFPKFKSKKNKHQSYREVQSKLEYLDFDNQRIKIPKLKTVVFRNKSKPKWFNQVVALKSITVEKTPSGKYYVSCLFELMKKVYSVQYRKDCIGLDFSPELLYVDSDGNCGKDFGYIPQKQKNIKKLTKLSRQLKRKHKGSKNYNKARIKLAKFEEHIANCRRDFLEKETLRLVCSYDNIAVEDLNLIGISKFLKTAKNMVDTSFGKFVIRLQSKGEDYRCNVVKADRYFPSSKLCSNCGWKYENLTLDIRKWTCPKCGINHIRDVNAAINLKNYIINIPKELRESMPVEGIEELAELALQISEYPLKQESQKLVINA